MGFATDMIFAVFVQLLRGMVRVETVAAGADGYDAQLEYDIDHKAVSKLIPAVVFWDNNQRSEKYNFGKESRIKPLSALPDTVVDYFRTVVGVDVTAATVVLPAMLQC